MSFGGKYNAPGDVERNVLAQLELAEDAAGLDPIDATRPERLQKLLYHLHTTTGQRVVILRQADPGCAG